MSEGRAEIDIVQVVDRVLRNSGRLALEIVGAGYPAARLTLELNEEEARTEEPKKETEEN